MNYFDKRLSKKLIKRLESIPKEEWISIGHTFNSWKFHYRFYDLIPKWWPLHGSDRAHKVIAPMIDLINKEFGDKEQLRFHNVWMGKMSNDEFEFWYENFHWGNIKGDYIEYYERRKLYDKIHFWEDDVFEKLKAIVNNADIYS